MSRTNEHLSYEELLRENSKLKERLSESEETLRAIRQGEVDALVIYTPQGEKIYTLKGAEQPYRILFEQMHESAVTISGDGTILFCNKRFADILCLPLERVIGSSIQSYVLPLDRTAFNALLKESTLAPSRGEIALNAEDGTIVPVLISASFLPTTDISTFCIIATDLTERNEVEMALRQAHDELEMKVKERTNSLERVNELLKAEVIERLMVQRQLVQEKENLSAALRIMGEAAIGTDGAGRITFMNRTAEDITGWRAPEAMNMPIDEVMKIQAEDNDQAKEILDRFLSSGSSTDYRTNLISKGGNTCSVAIRGIPIKDKHGSSIGFVAVFKRIGTKPGQRGAEQAP